MIFLIQGPPVAPETALSTDWVVKGASLIMMCLQTWTIMEVLKLRDAVRQTHQTVFGVDGNRENSLVAVMDLMRRRWHEVNTRVTTYMTRTHVLEEQMEPPRSEVPPFSP